MRTPTFAAATAVVTNSLLFVIKLTVGLLTGSVAVLSDAIDSGEDLIAASVALVSVRYSARPADRNHPYGYGKVESIAAGVEAGFITIGAAFITYRAVDALLGDERDIETGLAIWVMLAVAAVNIGLGVFVRGVGREHDSPALKADAAHLFTNAVQAAGVLAGLVLVRATGQWWIDPLVALGLAAYLVWIAAGILRGAMRDIVDARLPEHEERIIAAFVREHEPSVRGYHSLRTRRAGPYREIDMHLVLAPAATLADVHDTCDRIERQIEERFPRSYVIIHPEPDDGRPLTPPDGAHAPPTLGDDTPHDRGHGHGH